MGSPETACMPSERTSPSTADRHRTPACPRHPRCKRGRYGRTRPYHRGSHWPDFLRKPSSCGGEHCPSVLSRLICYGFAGEHTSKLLDAFCRRELARGDTGLSLRDLFLDHKMPVGERCDLGLVRDAKDLAHR